MDLDTARKKWFAHGTVGMLLFGSGVSVVFDSAHRRMTETVAELWLVEAVMGIVLLMVGLAYFGSAVRYMVHMDRIVEYSERRFRRQKSRKESEESRDYRRRANVRRKGNGRDNEIRLEPRRSEAL